MIRSVSRSAWSYNISTKYFSNKSSKYFLLFQFLPRPVPVWTYRAVSYLTNCRMVTLQNLHCRCFYPNPGALTHQKKSMVSLRAGWLTLKLSISPATGRRWRPSTRRTAWTWSPRASTRRWPSASASPRCWTRCRSSPADVTPARPKETWKVSLLWWKLHVSLKTVSPCLHNY